MLIYLQLPLQEFRMRHMVRESGTVTLLKRARPCVGL